MTEPTQPRVARGTTLIAGAVAAALLALLAFAPLASATPDPVASGSATVTLNKSWTKYLKTFGIKIQKVAPAKLKGQKATFTVTGGEMDPTNGLGTLNLGGGLKFKAGKKSAKVSGLVLSSATNTLSGKVGGKKVKIAKTSGLSYTRNGFGVNVTLKKLKLQSAAAKQLNKALGFSKGVPKPFLANKVIGSSLSEDQPTTTALLPTGTMSLGTNETTIKKLSEVEVKIETIAPTATSGTPTAPVFGFPITGGTIGPSGTAGTVQSSGGLKLIQKLPKSATEFLETEIVLGNFYTDLTAKTVSVEVTAHSNASKELDLGPLGRSSIANIAPGTVTADPTNRTVSVQNAAATLQPVAAEVLNAFSKVYQAWWQGVLEVKFALPPEVAKQKAEEKVANDHINSGDPLGTISFTAQGQ
jgi:hypothetical protein